MGAATRATTRRRSATAARRAKIDFTIGVDPSQAALKIKAGDIDAYTGNFPTADITQLSNDASLKDRIFTAARPAILTLFLNNTVAPFDNAKVRQAVNYAVNRTQIQRVWGGPSVGTPTDQILPPSVPDYRDYDAYPNEPDLDKAKQLMAGVRRHDAGDDAAAHPQRRRRLHGGVRRWSRPTSRRSASTCEIAGRAGQRRRRLRRRPENKAPMGLVTFSMDFPDGQAFINLLLDPAKPDFGGSYARFNDKSFIPEYEQGRGADGRRTGQGVHRPRREGHDRGRAVGAAAHPEPLRLRLGPGERLRVQPGHGRGELQHPRGRRADLAASVAWS